jgi:hypothetical protein
LGTAHPWTIARQRCASTDTDSQAENNGRGSRDRAQPAPNCQIPLSVQYGRHVARRAATRCMI